MEEKLEIEEKLEEEEEERRKREKLEKKPTRAIPTEKGVEKEEIKREKPYPPDIKCFEKVKEPKKITPIVFGLSKSTELKIPLLKEFFKIRSGEKISPIIIKEATDSLKLVIPYIERTIVMERPPLVNYVQILRSETTKIKPPDITLERIPYPELLSPPIYTVSKKEEIGKRVERVGKVAEIAITTPGRGEMEEAPNFFEFMFSISGEGEISSGNPKVIGLEEIAGDSYLGALRTICMRIYREKVGGKPGPTIISRVKKETFKREVEKWMRAEDKIFSVELDEREDLDKDFWDSVVDRIEELFSQNFGFIIFNKAFLSFPRHHIVDIINLKQKRMGLELKKKLASILWGFVDLEDELVEEFDHIFEIARRKFERGLKSIREPYLSAVKRHKGVQESDDFHFPIKLFVVKYLAEELLGRKARFADIAWIKERICTEEKYLELGEKLYPDIWVSTSAEKFANEVFEIETLFGEGEYPLKKVDETIEKYEKLDKPPEKVNIILDNLTFLRHINELQKKLSLHEILREKGKRKFDLKFSTLNLKDEKLIPLEDMIKELRTLKEMQKSD